MTRLIFVRHGQSEANLHRIFAGWTDAPLTEQGRCQAALAAEWLARYSIDAAYASDLSRAYETASIVAARQGLTVTPDPAFREIFAGEWEGLSYEEIERRYPEEYGIWRRQIGLCRCTGGESFVELQARVVGRLRELVALHAGQTVLIGTHATPVRVSECMVAGLSPEQAHTVPWTANASVTVLEYEDGEFRVALHGYYDFQGELATGLPRNV